MSLDYDLVIIGNTLEAFFAASKAVKLRARVALVLGEEYAKPETEIERFTLNYFNFLNQRWQNLTQWELNYSPASSLDFYQIKQWTEQVKEDLKEHHSLTKLSALGVDVISESGEFCRLPELGFVIKNRTLRSRNYLLAMGSMSSIPKIQGLLEVGYLTPETLQIDKLPDQLIIFSQTPIGIELAQNLNSFGKQVTLVVEQNNILPQEDEEAVQLIEAKLEAEGIKLFTNCPISQIRKIDNKKWIQAGDEAIEAEEIIVATKQKPKIKGLNLEGIKVCLDSDEIRVNNKLQTTNPRIYACGSVLGGYPLSNIAQYEAKIAVKNAIFYPIFDVNYHFCISQFFSRPMLSRVGLTENQAKQRYGQNIIVIKQNYKTITKPQIVDDTTGFCKIITHCDGTILGCHIVGNDSDELIHLVAFAMENNLKIQKFSQLFPCYSTMTEILFQISESWQYQRFQTKKFLNNWLDTLLFWRRKWNF